jgi:hypothetical protein
MKETLTLKEIQLYKKWIQNKVIRHPESQSLVNLLQKLNSLEKAIN